MTFDAIAAHKAICILELVDCPWKDLNGCAHRCAREDMTTHSQDSTVHMFGFAQALRELKADNRELKTEVAALRKFETDIRELKTDNRELMTDNRELKNKVAALETGLRNVSSTRIIVID